MERKMAEQVVFDLKRKNGPHLTILEAKAMKKIVVEGHEVYALKRNNIIFLAWKCENGKITTQVHFC